MHPTVKKMIGAKTSENTEAVSLTQVSAFIIIIKTR